MGLDMHITTKNNEIIHFVMSETLHSNIFSSSTRWSSAKNLRKIKDYYKTDCLLKNKDASSFIHELSEMKDRIIEGKDELHKIIEKINGKEISFIRISGD
ncbi:hypothetical protein QVN42_15155 [Yersinia nurmii]|uniref:Uncharacterized protein n=1 Tax=Yersinia nurmii TaxID=685706 RepID=A0AAW7K7C2_9GAMM|nr:hypothetical protein [Yersinia nurmii]MDN0088694.1 hypothetical protein [Yersinia nurmii]CNF23032.1 Uncharacterised protein [Yersinia nurmii]